MIKNSLMFILAAFMLLAFLPIIGSLSINGSEIQFNTISFTVTSGDQKILTVEQYEALESLYAGEAYGLTLTFNNKNYVLVDNYEIVDPNHRFAEIDVFGIYTDYTLIDDTESVNIFTFYDQDGLRFLELGEVSSFNYLDESVTITNPSDWTVSFDIEVPVATGLNALFPIIAVLITITSIVVYYKFK